jgi:hypothetical protein
LTEGNFVSGKVLRLDNGDWDTLQSTSEPDMAEPATLREFIRNYQPSGQGDTYQMLELWNHGGSFIGFGHDESSDTMMTLREIQEGVREGLAYTSLVKFDIIGFDACLMANFEVFLALSPYTKYIVASEDVEPGFGWDYTGIRSTSGLEQYGESIIESFVAQGRQNPRTLGLYDMEFFTKDFKPLFDNMVDHLMNALKVNDKTILMALNTASFSSKKVEGGGIDLGEFLKNLEATLPYNCKRGQYDFKVSELLTKYSPGSFGGVSSGDYLVKFAKNGESGDRHTGVTIFWPTSSNINSNPSNFDKYYMRLPNFGQSGWLQMIKAYHTLRNANNPSMTQGYCQGSTLKAEISTFTTTKGTLSKVNNNLRITVTASSEVGDSYSEWGVESRDGTVYVFSSNDGVISGSKLDFTWDRSATYFKKGSSTQVGFSYTVYDEKTSEKEIFVPVVYYAEGDVVPTSNGRYTGSGGYDATLYLKILANGGSTATLYVAATKKAGSPKAEVSREGDACATGCGKILTIYYTNKIDTFDKSNVLNYGAVFDWKDVQITREKPPELESGSVLCYIQVFAVYRTMWTYQILRNIKESTSGKLTFTEGESRLSSSSNVKGMKTGSYIAIGAVGIIALCCAAACFFFVGGEQALACYYMVMSLLGGDRADGDEAEMTGFVPTNFGDPKEMIRPGIA